MAWERTNDFWSTRDSWATEVRSLQAKAARTTKTTGFKVPTLQSKANYWKAYGKRMEKVYGRSGVVSFDVDPRLTRELQGLIDSVAPALAGAFDRELSRVMLEAFYEWPVLSGLSKASLDIGYEQLSPDEFAATLGNRAPYTVFIKGSPHLKLIRTPALLAGSRILEGLDLGN